MLTDETYVAGLRDLLGDFRPRSLLILDVADQAAAEAFNRDDPYTQAGLFERVEIRPFRITVGQS